MVCLFYLSKMYEGEVLSTLGSTIKIKCWANRSLLSLSCVLLVYFVFPNKWIICVTSVNCDLFIFLSGIFCSRHHLEQLLSSVVLPLDTHWPQEQFTHHLPDCYLEILSPEMHSSWKSPLNTVAGSVLLYQLSLLQSCLLYCWPIS